jgi:ubiquinone/menaquinone biosynthesis C-methylase UbiE
MARLQDIRDFWNKNPCGSTGPSAPIGTKEFFEQVERYRYKVHYGIPKIAQFHKYRGKKMLEIGCGLGTDLLQFAQNGAIVTGVDLTPKAIELAKKRFEIYNLPGEFKVLNAEEDLPFDDNSFDFVYSHGVIHHTPHTEKVVKNIYRVLKPNGEFLVMIYHKNSYLYYGSIMFFKKIGLRLLGWNLEFTDEEWLAFGTDGFGTPLAKVYTRGEARELFSEFRDVKTTVDYLSSKDIPVIGKFIPKFIDYPLGRLFGGFLWISGKK